MQRIHTTTFTFTGDRMRVEEHTSTVVLADDEGPDQVEREAELLRMFGWALVEESDGWARLRLRRPGRVVVVEVGLVEFDPMEQVALDN